MSGKFEDYLELVAQSEAPEALAPYAKRSFEPFDHSNTFVSGDDVRSYYQELVGKPTHRLDPRTPLQRERDRIVHSLPLRNLAEKFHVLYYKDQRIARNYITHAMRMAQITRALCRGLSLNQDFAEAIALGSKVGSTPFKHVSNQAIAAWVEGNVVVFGGARQSSLQIAPQTVAYPPWISACEPKQQDDMRKSIPVARMKNEVDRGYSAGKQSYLLLMTNPYAIEDSQNRWHKETAYGIWRHSLNKEAVPESMFGFSYEWQLSKSKHEFSWRNDTYEAMTVRLADDITWVIENLQDANHARVLSSQGQQDLFGEIHAETIGSLDEEVLSALARKDPGRIYDYFIRDCVTHTRRTFDVITRAHKDWLVQRQALRAGESNAPVVALSEEGYRTLSHLKRVLLERVFGDPRTENRNRVLTTILEFVARQFFGRWPGSLPSETTDWITRRSMRHPVFRSDEILKRANDDPYFRLHVVVTIMSELNDSDIFQMVGMGTI